MWPVVWKPPEVWEQPAQKKPSLVQLISLSCGNLEVHLICNIYIIYIPESEEKCNQHCQATWHLQLTSLACLLTRRQISRWEQTPLFCFVFLEQSAHESAGDKQSPVNY